jgi:hypothetical protein
MVAECASSAVTTMNAVALLAVIGSPGIVWWVMRRLTTGFMKQQTEHCKACRTDIDKRFDQQSAREKEIEERQFQLRQADIPHIREHFAKKTDLEASTAEIKRDIKELGAEMKTEIRSLKEKMSSDIVRIHTRIDDAHRS